MKERIVKILIDVCVGRACHQRGSYEIIQTLPKIINENNLQDKVELKASFCKVDCMNGVSMRIDREAVSNAKC